MSSWNIGDSGLSGCHSHKWLVTLTKDTDIKKFVLFGKELLTSFKFITDSLVDYKESEYLCDKVEGKVTNAENSHTCVV